MALEEQEDPNAWRAQASAAPAAWQSEEPPALAYDPPEGDPWAWWLAAMGNSFGLFDVLKPQTGFYRCRPRMRERGQPVVIWYDEEAAEWFAQLEAGPMVDVGWAWQHSHKHPISQELHDSVNAGGAWPEEVPRPARMGDNSATDEEVALDAIRQIDDACTAWLASIGGKITTEEQDQRGEGYRTRYSELQADIAARHKSVRQIEVDAKAAADALKKAADERLKLIDSRWKGDGAPLKFLDEATERLATPLSAYRTERAELRKKATEAAREACAAVAPALYSASSNDKTATRQPTTVKKPKGGRTTYRVEWSDRAAFVAQLLSMNPPPEDLSNVLTIIARRMLDAGAQVHGASLVEFVKV